MVFLWFSYCFPKVFLRFSYGFPGHGQPWPTMASHGRPWPAMAGHGRCKLRSASTGRVTWPGQDMGATQQDVDWFKAQGGPSATHSLNPPSGPLNSKKCPTIFPLGSRISRACLAHIQNRVLAPTGHFGPTGPPTIAAGCCSKHMYFYKFSYQFDVMEPPPAAAKCCKIQWISDDFGCNCEVMETPPAAADCFEIQ